MKVVKGENLATTEFKDIKRIYCILEFDQNGVVLDAKKESDHVNPEWKTKAILYYYYYYFFLKKILRRLLI